ncbi:MAG: hypothetical protein ABI954_12345 [Pyrinomonadaceae bacterium]
MLLVVLTISFLFLTLLFVAARRRHFLLPKTKENQIYSQLQPKFISLFTPDAKILAEIEQTEHRRKIVEESERLMAWASLIKFSELTEMPLTQNKKIEHDALEILTDRALLDEDVLALVWFVVNHQNFNVNQKLIKKFQAVWENSPDMQKTTGLFELAIRTDNAQLFQSVFTEAEQFIKNDQLSDLRLGELRELASSHFWLLSPTARMSGAGFWLKQKLADSRRAL